MRNSMIFGCLLAACVYQPGRAQSLSEIDGQVFAIEPVTEPEWLVESHGKNAAIVSAMTDAKAVAEALTDVGWDEEFVGAALVPYKGEQLSLYRSAPYPGNVSYWIKPENPNLPVTKFLSGGETEYVQQAAFYDAEAIRDKIIEGLTLAIESVCLMPGNLKEITAKASALGIVEVQATWEPEGICTD